MTLVLVLANRQCVIQFSDCRFLWGDGRVTDDEQKATALFCKDARLAVAYANLAVHGSFVTQDWLRDTLSDCVVSNGYWYSTLECFFDQLSHRFQKADLRGAAPLSIIYSGYEYTVQPPVIVWGLITNYQDANTGRDSEKAWKDFKWYSYGERFPRAKSPILVQRFGCWSAVHSSDRRVLGGLLSRNLSAAAISANASRLINQIAHKPEANTKSGDKTIPLIGRNTISVVIPSDQMEGITTGYFSDGGMNPNFIRIPDLVNVAGGVVVKDFSLKKIS